MNTSGKIFSVVGLGLLAWGAWQISKSAAPPHNGGGGVTDADITAAKDYERSVCNNAVEDPNPDDSAIRAAFDDYLSLGLQYYTMPVDKITAYIRYGQISLLKKFVSDLAARWPDAVGPNPRYLSFHVSDILPVMDSYYKDAYDAFYAGNYGVVNQIYEQALGSQVDASTLVYNWQVKH